MRINTISQIIPSKISKNIPKQVSLPTKTEIPVLASTVAAASGIYLANKSSEYNIFIKQLPINDETKTKLSNLKNNDGKQIFDLKTSKALLEASKLNDTTFFANVIRNLDNITEFKKLCDEYSVTSSAPDKIFSSKVTLKPNGNIITETTSQSDNETTVTKRINNGNSIEEKISKTVNNKKVLEETTKYNLKKHSIERQTFDNENKNQKKK